MGQEQSSVSVEEADSVSFPGRKCFVTGALDEYCDYDRLWLELKSGLRTDFVKDPLLKLGEVEDLSENEFVITKTYDKGLLQAPTDISAKTIVRLDKDKGEVYEEVRDAIMNIVQEVRIMRTLRDPLRVEMLGQRIRLEERRSGDLVNYNMYNTLKAALKREDILCSASKPSRLLPIPGVSILSAISQPLDGFTTFEDLMSSLRETYRTQAFHPAVKTVEVSKERKLCGHDAFDVLTVSDGPRLVELKLATEPVDISYHLHVETDQVTLPGKEEENGVFYMVSSEPETHRIIEATHLIVHKNPLTVESWAHWAVIHERDPDRTKSAILKVILNGYIAVLLERVAKKT